MKESVHNEMAMWAFEEVEKVDKNLKEFRSLARSFPSILQVNGLGMAISFLDSKKKVPPYDIMNNIINKWTKRKFQRNGNNNDDLIKCIVKLDSASYRMYTNEIMNLCLWIKRFAEGLIDGE